LVNKLKEVSKVQNQYGADANWGVLDGVHVGATWRMQLNRLRVAALTLS